jgi:hypothetical protein
MYMVYWTTVENEAAVPHAESFDTSEMVVAMKFMEELRARQRAGESVCFITMCSEHPDVVGHPGVDVTGRNTTGRSGAAEATPSACA